MRLARLLFAVFLPLLMAGSAWGQATVLQGGPWAPGRAPMYLGQQSAQPIVQDSGPAAGGPPGVGLSELGITARGPGPGPYPNSGTGEFASHFCIHDGPITSPNGYHFLCLDPNTSNGGLISFGATGAAAQTQLSINLNGIIYPFPFSIGGISGPLSTTVGNVALWNNTVGTLLSVGPGIGTSGANIPLLSTNNTWGGAQSFSQFSGAMTSGSITGASVSNSTISGGSVAGAAISNGTISGAAISNGTIAGAAITGGSITGTPVSATTLSIGGVTSPNVIPYINIKTLGAVGNGTTDDSAAFLAAFNSTTDATYYLPPGTYRIPCGINFTAGAAASFIGAGQSLSIIKFDPTCTLTNTIMAWPNKSGIAFHDLTVDFNTPALPAAQFQVGIGFFAQAGSAVGLQVYNCQFINAVDHMLMLVVAAGSTFNYNNVWIHENFLEMAAGNQDNQGITLTQGAGFINSPIISNNIQVGTGLQYDGSHGKVSNNDISGWRFGTGIFSNEDAEDIFNVFSNNTEHDAPTGTDSNNTATGGFENGASFSTVIGNVAFNLGGSGISNFGNNNILQGNTASNIGQNGTGGAGGINDQAGLTLQVDGGTAFVSNNVTVVGNKTYDTGSGTTKFGYGEEVGFTGNVRLRGNDFSGAQQALNIQSPNTSVDAGFISTASNPISTSATSLAFAPNQGLDTASYHSWHLACHDINPATAETVGIQVGEGVGGSFAWEAGAHYAVQEIINSTATPAVLSSATLTMLELGSDAWGNNNGAPGSFSADLGNLAPAAPNNKLMRVSASYFKNASNPGSVSGTGFWNGDTNAITALRVVTATGDALAGSCTLTGSP